MRRNRRTCLPERTESPKRTPMAPPQLDVTRRIEPEVSTNEMALLYEQYLQTLMVENLMKIQGHKGAKNILIQLASLEKKNEECQQKLHEFKIRKNEFGTLNEVQKNMESQIQKIDIFLAANESKLSKVIDQIHLYLATFDKLVCKDVIIPEISENLAKLFDIIDQFNGVLDLVDQFIGNKSSSMTLMNRDLQEFNESFMVAEKLLKGARENLENLQIETLKVGSTSLE